MTNKICKLFGIHTPIVQSPVHTLTNGKMVAAVAEAGALGILGINAGFNIQVDATTGASTSNDDTIGNEADFSILDTMTERNLMNEQIDTALENTFRPFAVEIASNKNNPDDDPTALSLVKLMRKRRLNIALFEGFGKPISEEWVALLHENGIKIIEKVNNLSAGEKACNDGLDTLVYTGSNISNFTSRLKAKIPILAGNNISYGPEIRNAFENGADGVFVATPFAICKESPVANNIKKRIINGSSSELISFQFPTKKVYSLRGELPNKLHEMTLQNEDPNRIFTIGNRYQGLINGMAKGNLNSGYTDIDKNIDQINQIYSAEEVVNNILNEIPKEKR